MGSVIHSLKPVTWEEVKKSAEFDEDQKLLKVMNMGFPLQKDDMDESL